jgi:ergothioneine biosynthesis protein EgtB
VTTLVQPQNAVGGSPAHLGSSAHLGQRYRAVRAMTERLAEPLSPEDCQVQSMPDASPVKWHLAHTTWFFETFVLGVSAPGYQVFHPAYRTLFNSYYNAVGDRWPRAQRGIISRPNLSEVYAYRGAVDRAIEAFLESAGASLAPEVAAVIELGINHEQQHQELILTDLKHVLAQNPLRPVYRAVATSPKNATCESSPTTWSTRSGGVISIGHDGRGFAFDNESPRHRVCVERYALGTRLVTCGEYLAFMDDGGYSRPELWLSDGWSAATAQRWEAPLYWERMGSTWSVATLSGFHPVVASEPVCHVSYYEADAFSRWASARLPTEAEWELAARECSLEGNFLDDGNYHPRPAGNARADELAQMFGDAWEWTQSPYTPYPGSRPVEGALGEYNAKFMCNQMVLRGGSCATPASHIRATYRNFFPPDARWQFTGIRMAKDL